ncbi:MAG: 16S rRNA (cytidine(1402)-2'-O)-methyltransferase [Lachnospiraceae bacterium]|nr:16S rRNA (cytidine(1402)-2'-O)-methyltransferase [Lachnospiraceae bacterium]
MIPGKLSLCATPIGNLEDISFRVLRVLKEADCIAAEDTRNSIKLLNHFAIQTPMTAYHEFNKVEKARDLVSRLQRGENIALITDAGTPCISDPGEELVRQAVDAGIRVESIPGPAAFVTALTLSALPTRRFVFEAFLPTEKSNKKERTAILQSLAGEERTILLYEAPHHLLKTLEDLRDAFGENRKLSLARELTKKHEEVLYTDLEEAIRKYREEEPRGEYVLVLEGLSREKRERAAQEKWLSVSLSEHFQNYVQEGYTEKEAIKLVAKDRGLGKREVYKELKG